MNRCALLLLFTLPLAQPAIAQFEGIVETRNLTTDEMGNLQRFTMTMWIKKDRIRVQSSAFGNTPATTMIYRSDRHIIWMLNDEEKSYFEILQEENPKEIQSGPESRLEDKPVIRRPGRTKKILGYPCEQLLLSREEGETEIWGTKQLPELAATTSRVLGQSDAGAGGWMGEIAELALYPLAASTRIEGRLVESQETTSIQSKDLSPDLFSIPEGYRKQALGDIQKPPH